MIAIVDYRAGNLRFVFNAFEGIGHNSVVIDVPEVVRSVQAIVIPGVEAFGNGMATLNERELLNPLKEAVRKRVVFYLWICLGLQFLAIYAKRITCRESIVRILSFYSIFYRMLWSFINSRFYRHNVLI